MCATGWINGSIGVATAYFSSLMTELWVDIVLARKVLAVLTTESKCFMSDLLDCNADLQLLSVLTATDKSVVVA